MYSWFVCSSTGLFFNGLKENLFEAIKRKGRWRTWEWVVGKRCFPIVNFPSNLEFFEGVCLWDSLLSKGGFGSCWKTILSWGRRGCQLLNTSGRAAKSLKESLIFLFVFYICSNFLFFMFVFDIFTGIMFFLRDLMYMTEWVLYLLTPKQEKFTSTPTHSWYVGDMNQSNAACLS